MIRVELRVVYSDGEGSKVYEIKFVDDDGTSSGQLKVLPDGTMELVEEEP